MSRFVLTAELSLTPPSQASVRRVVNQINQQLSGIRTPDILNAQRVQQQAQQTVRALRNVQGQIARTGQAATRLQSRIANRLFDAGTFSLVNAAVAAVTGAFANAARSAVAFEKEMVKIAQVTKKSTQELGILVSTINDVSTSFGTSSAELVGVGRTLSQAGLGARDVEVALRAVAATDLAPTFENMAKTAEGAIAIFGQFGTSVDELEGQLGSINALAGRFAVESGDLIEAIKRGGSAFKTAGGTLEEYLALVTTVRSTTREGAAQISTGLRTIFTRIQRPQTIQYFKELGVELTDVTGKFVGGFEAVRRLAREFGNLEQGDTQLIEVAQQLGGVRQVTRVLPLLQEFKKAEDALAVAQGGTNSVLEDRNKALDTYSAKLGQLKESVLELGRTVGEVGGGVLKGLIDTFATLAQIANSTLKGISSLDLLLGDGTTGFVGFGVAVGVASATLLGFNTRLAIATGGLTILVPIFAKMANASDEANEKLLAMVTTVTALAAAYQLLGGAIFTSSGAFAGFGAAGGSAAGSLLGNAAAGAAGGAGGALLTQAITGREAEAVERFTQALETGNEAIVGEAAVAADAAKNLSKAGIALGVGVGAVASVFLGPIGGALVGALTGIVFELLSTSKAMQDFAVGVRDVLSQTTGIFGYILVRSNALIRATAEAQVIAKNSITQTNEAVKAFGKAVTDAKDELGNLKSEDLTKAFNDKLGKVGSDLDALDRRKAAILDKDSDGTADRAVGELNTFTESEERALTEIQAARRKSEEALFEAFQQLAADTIRNGGDFNDAFSRLSPALQKLIKEEFGTSRFENLFTKEVRNEKTGELEIKDGDFKAQVIAKDLNDFRDAVRNNVKLQDALAASTRKVLETQDEAARIIAEFGGAAYTAAQQEQNLLQQANAGARQYTVGNLSADSLEERGLALAKELGEVRAKLERENTGGEKTTTAKNLEAREKELLRLSKQNYDITKKLIDIRKEELRIIDLRNAREQDALQKAITGDFGALFDAQAAQGVIASVTSGGGTTGFNQQAIAAAIEDLRAQRDAGVREINGRSINSVIRELASGGLGNLGLGNQADVLAGTTPEQEALRKEIRNFAAVLPASAKAEEIAAKQQLQAAQMQMQAAREQYLTSGGDPTKLATGGIAWRRRGSDTVPAMLTPGEFVVRRQAVQRGNNLNILRAMNGGGDAKSVGGTVYANDGGAIPSTGGFDFSMLSKAASAMESASRSMKTMIEKLGNLKINVSLAPTSHTVNLTGTSALAQIGDKIKEDVMNMVGDELKTYKVTSQGRLDNQVARSNLPI